MGLSVPTVHTTWHGMHGNGGGLATSPKAGEPHTTIPFPRGRISLSMPSEPMQDEEWPSRCPREGEGVGEGHGGLNMRGLGAHTHTRSLGSSISHRRDHRPSTTSTATMA